MSKHASVCAALACVAAIALGGCGGASVVHIEGSPGASIDSATLRHWMQSLVGGDFRQSIGAQGPTGLVSLPADYLRCIDSAKFVAPRSFFNQLRTSKAQLDKKCHELYRSVKAQALSFLISAQWTLAEAARHHMTASEADVRGALARFTSQLHLSEPALRNYLVERQWSLADLLYGLKQELLLARLLGAPEQPPSALTGEAGAQPATRLANPAALIARTNCAAGFLVPNCSRYRGPATVSPTPDAILEAMVQGKPI